MAMEVQVCMGLGKMRLLSHGPGARRVDDVPGSVHQVAGGVHRQGHAVHHKGLALTRLFRSGVGVGTIWPVA